MTSLQNHRQRLSGNDFVTKCNLNGVNRLIFVKKFGSLKKKTYFCATIIEIIE